MASFFIQTDKDFYFAGDTVNGNVFVSVNAMIVGAQGLSLKFSGYECVKWVETIELYRPSPSTNNHSKNKKGKSKSKSFSKAFDPIAAIPSFLLAKSDVLRMI